MMEDDSGNPAARPHASRALSETRRASHCALASVTPGQRMEMAFAISQDARKLHLAGLQSQGFAPSEVSALGHAKRR